MLMVMDGFLDFRTQNSVGITLWGFDSPLRHQLFKSIPKSFARAAWAAESNLLTKILDL